MCGEEEDDLQVYPVSESVADILSKRKDERYCSSLIGRYMMDSELKFREFCRVSRDLIVLLIFYSTSFL
jgi:hypothetical protein